MSISIEIDIRDGASPTLLRIANSVAHRRPLNAAIGKRGEIELQRHFTRRTSEPNKRGWTSPAGRFWERIRKTTVLSKVDEAGATVTIADPAMAQKVYGGVITPKERKYLALPAIAAAYGRSPLTQQQLKPIVRFIDGSRRAVALGTIEGKGKDRKETIWYWLVKSVRQDKDEQALPPSDQFEAALLAESDEFIARLLA